MNRKSIALRSNTFEKFMVEAYGCKPVEVALVKLKSEDVVAIKSELKIRSQSRTKPRVQSSLRVPIAIVEVEVTTVDGV